MLASPGSSLRPSDVIGNWLPHAPAPARPALERLLGIGRLVDLYSRAEQDPDHPLFDALLEQLHVRIEVSGDANAVPAEGPVVAVANHPYGMLDGVALGALLTRWRPDARLLANRMLGIAPAFQKHCIFVDAFGTSGAKSFNSAPLRQAIRFLEGGGLLGVFPGGEVASWDAKRKAVADPPWSASVASLIRRTGAVVVPVYFEGANGLPFQLLGMVHPILRTANLANEFLNKQGKELRIRIGSPIRPNKLAGFAGDAEAIQYLRWRTELLAHRGGTLQRASPTYATRAELDPPVPEAEIEKELDALPESAVLDRNGEWRLVIAEAGRIPSLLKEVGRVRELTFRAAGEGTGQASDLDEFDPHYLHLILWNESARAVAGGYRLGVTSRLLRAKGIRGLYTSTLFEFDPLFFSRIGPAVELGRSFVHPGFQKQFAPLLLLWKGIGKWIAQNPENPVLFGAVSMSNDYSEGSRRMVAEFCAAEAARDPLAALVKPRRGFRARSRKRFDSANLRRFVHSIEDLDEPLADLEPDGKGVPVLLRQYCRLGGRLLGVHVDSRFSDSLDGLILVDLRQAERRALDRYMTAEGAAAFLRRHQVEPRRAG